ncbi:MAG: hypothetical protein L0G99_12600, partial [Propionibacteriales bacterium]|nr:hypothetical protein [Propionibacteriales bacterium]
MTHFSLTGGAAIESALATALAGGPPIAPLPHTDPSAPQNRGVLAMLRAAEESGHPGSGPELLTDCAAVVATSGSTGTPKGVLLSRAAIRAAVSATHERLGGPGDWVLVLP